jgi:hypothetical protein
MASLVIVPALHAEASCGTVDSRGNCAHQVESVAKRSNGQLEQLAATDEDFVGKLPSGERLSERIARCVGLGDRTYRKARDVLSYEAQTDDGSALRAAIETQMDESGTVDGPHRALQALRTLEEWAADPITADVALPELARLAWDDTRLDLADVYSAPKRLQGKVDASHYNARIRAEQEAKNDAPAGESPAPSGVADPAPADEHDADEGGSDVSTPETSEPAPLCREVGPLDACAVRDKALS